ncbi:uncharacterized protein LOC117331788 [Pecten maximus]|uniref:uncharacterized protein LOC117331788 n=1 Tax=Pecten maximus TaxID=6579 RepID=UPI001458E108|nr:uncharacterized protein LOC117331788 [Pecten maximus]XP_033746563.1 uncharacterized protein LOC117331788 [Pecten maximus]
MDFKLKLVLMLCILLGVLNGLKGEENNTIGDYFRIECGQHKINPFEFFCRDGIRVPCDESHCMERLVEDSRIGCALFCDEVLLKLEQLPKEVAVLRTVQKKSTAKIAAQKTENSKLKDQINKQNISLANMNKAISDEKQRNRDLKDERKIFMILVIVFGIMILVCVLILIILTRTQCVHHRKSKKSLKGIKKPLIHKTSGDGADSAFNDNDHKCDDLNKVNPTDAEKMAPVVPNDLQRIPQELYFEEPRGIM